MNITLNSFSNYAISFLKEEVLPTLTAQQKKILIISSIAFGFLAACYAISRCFKPQMEGSFNDDGGLDGPGKDQVF